MPTEAREHEERSHSARYLILIFLVLVAMCGVFFSAGFIVGRNEGGLHSAPSTEVVNTPGTVPPAFNPPPDGAPQDGSAGHDAANSAPDTVVIPPSGAGANSTPPAEKPADTAREEPTAKEAPPAPVSTLAPASAPAVGELGQGITLQVVASHTRQDAEKVAAVLTDKGYAAFVLTPEAAHLNDNLFRVLVGPFSTRADADKARDKLKADGFKPFVRH